MSDRLLPYLRLSLVLLAAIVAVCSVYPEWSIQSPPQLFPEEKAALAFSIVVALASMLPPRFVEVAFPLTLATVITIASAEMLLRVAVGDSFATTIRLDGEQLYVVTPGAQKTFKHQRINGGQTIPIRIDSDGFRQSDVERPSDGKRLLVLGDSFIAGEFSRAENTFAEQLASALGGRVRSYNGGVAGYGPDQVLLGLRRNIEKVRPHAIVIGLFAGNDYGDVARNHLFRIANSGSLSRQRAVVDDGLRIDFQRGVRRWLLGRLIVRLRNAAPSPPTAAAAQDSAARELIAPWLMAREKEVKSMLAGDTVVDNLWMDTPDVDIQVDPFGEGSRLKRAIVVAIADSMAAIAASAKVPLLFVAIPAAIDVEDRYDGGIVDSVKYPLYSRGGATSILADSLRVRGYRVVDLFPAFRSVRDSKLYFRNGENHWNDLGQLIAAKVVSDSMRVHGLMTEALTSSKSQR